MSHPIHAQLYHSSTAPTHGPSAHACMIHASSSSDPAAAAAAATTGYDELEASLIREFGQPAVELFELELRDRTAQVDSFPLIFLGNLKVSTQMIQPILCVKELCRTIR